jgi:hypothetical protein
LILGLLFGCGDEISSWPKKAFEERNWKATKESSRFVYVRDLIEGKKLIGKSKDEIYLMLGEPGFDDSNGQYITYIIKEDRSEFYILDIRFDNERPLPRVKDVFVRTP